MDSLELARAAGPECIKFMIQVRDYTTASRRDRLAACAMLLDRGYGKPIQAIAAEEGGPTVM